MSNKPTSNQQTGKKIIKPLQQEEWYQYFIENCKATIIETGFVSAMELIKGKWILGEEILQAKPYFKKRGLSMRKALKYIATDLGKSERSIWQCYQFRKKYPDFMIEDNGIYEISLEAQGKYFLQEGKAIRWYVIANKYLPKPKTAHKPSWLRYTDVWNFASCDKRFGTEDFPGKIPGQILQNILYYYTTKKNLIIDPMAGGGTTVDVCRNMNRKCIAFDIKPVRKDIIRHDATKKWPSNEKADLVFIDPPYWSQQEEVYGGISRLSYEDYLKEMELIFEQASKFLKEKKILTVLIAPMAIKTKYKDIPFDFTMILLEKFSLIGRIAVPVSSQQIGPQVMGACKRKKELVAVNRDLLIFQKKPKAS